MRHLLLFVFVFLAIMFCSAKTGYAGGWFGFLMLQSVVIWLAYFVLSFGAPASLAKASKDNCYRINGSKSRRRERKEQIALAKFHIDIFATLVLVAISGNLLFIIIDAYVIPLPIASDAISLFSFDMQSWRDKIGDRNLDREYAAFQGLGGLGNTEVLARPHFIKSSFPTLIGTTFIWLLISIYVVRVSYLLSIKQLTNGIRSRSTEYLNADLGRLQG